MSAPPKATLPAIRHTRVLASDGKVADAVVEQRAKQAVEDEHFQTIQRLLISKRLFDTSKHILRRHCAAPVALDIGLVVFLSISVSGRPFSLLRVDE